MSEIDLILLNTLLGNLIELSKQRTLLEVNKLSHIKLNFGGLNSDELIHRCNGEITLTRQAIIDLFIRQE